MEAKTTITISYKVRDVWDAIDLDNEVREMVKAHLADLPKRAKVKSRSTFPKGK